MQGLVEEVVRRLIRSTRGRVGFRGARVRGREWAGFEGGRVFVWK